MPDSSETQQKNLKKRWFLVACKMFGVIYKTNDKLNGLKRKCYYRWTKERWTLLCQPMAVHHLQSIIVCCAWCGIIWSLNEYQEKNWSKSMQVAVHNLCETIFNLIQALECFLWCFYGSVFVVPFGTVFQSHSILVTIEAPIQHENIIGDSSRLQMLWNLSSCDDSNDRFAWIQNFQSSIFPSKISRHMKYINYIKFMSEVASDWMNLKLSFYWFIFVFVVSAIVLGTTKRKTFFIISISLSTSAAVRRWRLVLSLRKSRWHPYHFGRAQGLRLKIKHISADRFVKIRDF